MIHVCNFAGRGGGGNFPIFFVRNPYDSFKNTLPEGNTYNEHLLGGTLSRLLHSPV